MLSRERERATAFPEFSPLRKAPLESPPRKEFIEISRIPNRQRYFSYRRQRYPNVGTFYKQTPDGTNSVKSLVHIYTCVYIKSGGGESPTKFANKSHSFRAFAGSFVFSFTFRWQDFVKHRSVLMGYFTVQPTFYSRLPRVSRRTKCIYNVRIVKTSPPVYHTK